MKLPDTKLDLCAAKDDCRTYLNGVYLDVDNKRAIATNGHMLAVVPADVDYDEQSGLIDTAIMQQARKRANVKAAGGAVAVHCNGAFTLVTGASYPRDDAYQESVQYPDIDKVVPERRDTCDIAINADYLAAVQAAIVSYSAKHQGVKLYFGRTPDGAIDPNASIRIEPVGDDSGAHGVVMPMRAD